MTNMSIRLRNAVGWLLPGILALAMAFPVLAADTSDSTYQATVPVSDTSTDQRSKAFAEALDHVLARVAGHALQETPDTDEAATYVQQYQYRRAPADAGKPFVLSVSFAPDSVRRLARELGAVVADADDQEDTDMASEAPGGADAGDRQLWISGIHSGRDYADVMRTLRSAAGVEGVDVHQADGEGMLVRVRTVLALAELVGMLDDAGHFSMSQQSHAGASASLHWEK